MIRHQARMVISLFAIIFLLAGSFAMMTPLPASAAPELSTNIVIRQVYGGGGNSGAQYRNDFIELFNRGATAVNISGWSVQYASSTGTTWQMTALSGVIQPGQYFLIQGAQGAGGVVPLPTPDVLGNISMSAVSGKVALVSDSILLSGSCPTGGNIIDLVGYGSTTNCSETTPAPTLNNTTAAMRNMSGCAETDNNSSDFSVGAPNPLNTASPFSQCFAGRVFFPLVRK